MAAAESVDGRYLVSTRCQLERRGEAENTGANDDHIEPVSHSRLRLFEATEDPAGLGR